MKKTIELICVTQNNNNKFYRMIPNGDMFTVEYGRVGCEHPQTATYPMSQWDKKYREKINKGYVDNTSLMEAVNVTVDTPDTLSDSVSAIINSLFNMASDTVKRNYTVAASKITKAMCDKAQSILDSLTGVDVISDFNRTLVELFRVIPRKMKNVNDWLAYNVSEFAKIIQREQDLLDACRGAIVSDIKVSMDNLTISDIDDSDRDVIIKALGRESGRYRNAWRVSNKTVDKAFSDMQTTEKLNKTMLLWHGSRNENWWSILNTGLLIRPTNAVITGKMFGYGLYFAPLAKKSLGYTSLTGSYWARGNSNKGYMALMEVSYSKKADVDDHKHFYSSLTKDSLASSFHGANMLYAHAGKVLHNDEIIVYSPAQVRIKYLVELG